MLSIYDPYEDVFERPLYNIPLRHMASELMKDFGFANTAELNDSLQRTFEVCLIMNIPITDHFKKVYLYANHDLTTDWLLSDLATYLLLMNGNNRNYNVARARMYIAAMKERH